MPLRIDPQPDLVTCGPTCLHAVYRHFGREQALAALIDEIQRLDHGGTLDVFLANHALRGGYRATIYTYNLGVFDPTWFEAAGADLAGKLRAQAAAKTDPALKTATRGYLEFLERGGELRFQDLTRALLRKLLAGNRPVLTGLSSTYLYRSMREYGPDDADDDIRGEPAGHFVVLAGYEADKREIRIADPLFPNPHGSHYYSVGIDRVIGAILLGVMTFDANLLVIRP